MNGDLRHLLFIYALQNAVKHHGTPKKGTVIGLLMGRHPEFRDRGKEVGAMVQEVLLEVEAIPQSERKGRLEALAPELIDELSVTSGRSRDLPALPDADRGVVMRFAPNPSGPLHLGHARAAILNDYYVRRYGGRYILRIEDTDPRRVDPEAYLSVQEDVDWLGLMITDIVYQSDRLDIYYRCCRDLITIGAAYVCTCDPGRFRELRLARKPCPCRENPAEENLSLWQKMLDGEFVEGEVTVRIKTDISHPDPAMRDFSLFRIVNSPIHPRTDATVYPLMNFSVTVDDHLLGITHVIRGKDHIANTLRQRYLFDYFGWVRPHYIHYGRMSISGVVLSTSGMREGIASGTYSGWDDIRLGTLRALARRGIRPEAVRNAMLDISIGETDISFSWENLYAHNKAIVDPEANRYFFVPDPVEFMIRDAPIHEAKALLHPNDPSRGYRALTCRGSIVIPRDELAGNAKRSMLRLKDLFNVRIEETDGHPVLVYAGDSLEEARKAKAPIIQWLPAEEKLPCVLHGQEGDCTGFCEPRVAEEIGNVVQFERIGFARIDLHTACGIEALFLHR